MGHHNLGHSFGHHSGHHGHQSSHHGHHSGYHGHQSIHHGHHSNHHGHQPRHHGHLESLVRAEHGHGYHHHGNDHIYDHACPMCFLTMFGFVLLIGGIVMAVVLEGGLSTLGIVLSVVGFLLFVGGIIGGNISQCHDSKEVDNDSASLQSGASFPENQQITASTSGYQQAYQAVVDNPPPPYAPVSN